MKFSVWFKLCAPMALLALGSLNASAATCASVSGGTLDSIIATNPGTNGSCTIGDLTFSNFYFNYTSGTNTGAPTGTPSPTDPNAATNVTMTFAEITDGVTADPWGTVGSASAPLYELVTDYSSGSDSVGEFQNEQYYVSYLVTDNLTGSIIDEVDDNVVGTGNIMGSSATLTNKSICSAGVFVQSGGIPSNTCSSGNTYEAVDLGSGGTALNGIGTHGDDSSSDFTNGGNFQGPGSPGSSNFGVYDQANMNGGNTSPAGTASITQVENDFQEELPSGTGTPEPATFVLFGGALIGLGVIRRKKSV